MALFSFCVGLEDELLCIALCNKTEMSAMIHESKFCVDYMMLRFEMEGGIEA